MEHKNIIIDLITQELRFNQLYFKLEEIGMEPQEYTISLIDPILQLMGLPPSEGSVPPNTSDRFADLYIDCIYKVKDFPNLTLSRDLIPLAEACYYLLIAFLHSENKAKR